MIKRVGDTLVEVTLAIGIFSMVAVAIVAVMNSGTSGSQNTLETTLTREEVDTQAEALRFIHSAYIADMDTKTAEYVNLWESITSKALTVESQTYKDAVTNYNSSTCDSVYDNAALTNNIFVINPNQLNDPSNALVEYNNNKFVPASTYPRLIYGTATNNSNTDSLIDSGSSTLYRAEGIYVFAVKDGGKTTLVGDDKKVETDSAYYDFYIRTCWYGSGDETPSSVSTIIRLYDPSPLASSTIKTNNRALIRYNTNGGDTNDPTFQKIDQGAGPTTLAFPNVTRRGYEFLGWKISSDDIALPSGSGLAYNTGYNKNNITCTNSGCTYTLPGNLNSNITIMITAQWKRSTWSITYNTNGSSYNLPHPVDNTNCFKESTDPCPITTETVTRSGYKFLGWSESSTATVAQYESGGSMPNPNRNVTLYAVWKSENLTLAIVASWSSNTDYESNVVGTYSNGTRFESYYGNAAISENGNAIAILNKDCTGSCKTETFVINTLGGRNYYYYICRYKSGKCKGSVSTSSGITVTVYAKDPNGSVDLTIGGNAGTTYDGKYRKISTYKISDAKGYSSGGIWNVFAYKDGMFVLPKNGSNATTSGTITSSALTNY